ncbi:MAG: glycosyltransferase, partial [Myxococcota bacterium]
MVAGVPTVASAAGGLAEIVEHENTGLLVPIVRDGPHHTVDVDALAAAQLRLIDDQALADKLAERGRADVLARFLQERMVTGTRRVYDTLLGSPDSASPAP